MDGLAARNMHFLGELQHRLARPRRQQASRDRRQDRHGNAEQPSGQPVDAEPGIAAAIHHGDIGGRCGETGDDAA